MIKFISKSENDTISFANEFAKKINKDSVLILKGDLGAGKTKFTEGILKNFGLEKEISSPTFTIVNEYKTKNINIFHFDLYRLSDLDEFYAMGGEEYLRNGICIFEWGEMIEKLLESNFIRVTLGRNDKNEDYREIKIEEL